MRGLVNPGSLCYLITLLQQLQAIPQCRDAVRKCAEQSLQVSRSKKVNKKAHDRELDDAQSQETSSTALSKDEKKMHKRMLRFLRYLDRMLTYISDADADEDNSDEEHDNDNHDEDEDDDSCGNIVPFYEVLCKLLNEDVNIDKARDCSEFFSHLCKVLLLIQRDPTLSKALQTQSILSCFLGKQMHVLETSEENEDDVVDISAMMAKRMQTSEPPSGISNSVASSSSATTVPSSPPWRREQLDSYYYLSIDVSTGSLEASLARYSTRSNPFPFLWKPPITINSLPSFPQPPQPPLRRLTTKHSCLLADHLPPVLVMQLRRFAFDTSINYKRKQLRRFTYPRRLNMAAYCTDSNVGGSVQEALQYRLAGVVIHAGASADTGHYYALVSKPSQMQSQEEAEECETEIEWFLCDDDRVLPYDCTDAQLARDTFGGYDDEAEDEDTEDNEDDDCNDDGEEEGDHECVGESQEEQAREDIEVGSKAESEGSELKPHSPCACAMMLFYVRCDEPQRALVL